MNCVQFDTKTQRLKEHVVDKNKQKKRLNRPDKEHRDAKTHKAQRSKTKDGNTKNT